MIIRIRVVAALASFLHFFGMATAAWAYVPPSSFLVRSLARKHVGYKRIQIKSVVIRLDSAGQPVGPRFKEQTAYYPSLGLLKSWASDDQGVMLYETEVRERAMPPGAMALFETNSARMIEALRAKGVPVQSEADILKLPNEDERRSAEKESMARWNRSVAWVIGASANKAALAPQFWIEKDTFYPLRLIAALQKDDSALSDLQYEGFRTFEEFPYPKTVTWVKANKEPYFRAEAQEVLVDQGPDLTKAPVHEGWTAAGTSEPAPLRELMRLYYGLLR